MDTKDIIVAKLAEWDLELSDAEARTAGRAVREPAALARDGRGHAPRPADCRRHAVSRERAPAEPRARQNRQEGGAA